MEGRTRPFFIGIAGGTGSGKTLLTAILAEKYAHLGVVILDQDSYYRDRSYLSLAERKLVNYDDADAIDHDLLFEHLRRLVAGESIDKPEYSFTTHTRQPYGKPLSAKGMVFLEGLFALCDPRCRSLLDLKVFVDADADVRFIRRLRRDVLERARTVESVIDQYLGAVRPMHELYVQPTQAYADIVVDNTGLLDSAVTKIEKAISEKYALYTARNATGG